MLSHCCLEQHTTGKILENSHLRGDLRVCSRVWFNAAAKLVAVQMARLFVALAPFRLVVDSVRVEGDAMTRL